MNAPFPRRDVENAPSRPRRPRVARVETLLLFAVPAALLAAFFLRPALENERFSYRDVGYFYHPLFEQIQREWERGRLPLWDPFENLGQPLAGNPTSSVFYPGKAIFFLSSAGCVDFNACFSLYIIGHVAISFFGVYFLTRRLRISRPGAVLAGLSYSFSGPILFQYSNVVFLVGAAWLPFLALYSLDFFASAAIGAKLKSAAKLSVAQALAILGGEPQVVYLSTIAFFFFAFLAPVRLVVKTGATASVRRVRDRRRARLALGLFLAVAASTATFLLAAPQILPSAELIARSGRAASGPPRSLWEIPAALWANSAKNNADATAPTAQNAQDKESAQNRETTQNGRNGETAFFSALLGGEIENNGRNRATYRFSVGPWRWAERLFPNVGGRQFPRSSRWFAIFPEEIAVWTPTLYCGVVPYLLALSAARFRLGARRRRQNRSKRQIRLRALSPYFSHPPRLTRSMRSVDADAIGKLSPFSRRERSTAAAFRVWATWLVVVSTAAALGGFGVVWAARFGAALLSGAEPARTFVDGDPLGGVYWLLNVALPKFVEFRYPAKLLTLSALGLAVLAGFGWDDRRFSRRFFAFAVATSTLALAGFAVVSALGDGLFASIRTVDPLYGPFQPRLAFESVRGAFAQTAVVLAATLLLLAVERRFYQTKNNALTNSRKPALKIDVSRRTFAPPQAENATNKEDASTAQKTPTEQNQPILTIPTVVALAVAAISAVDLYVANGWTLATAPPEVFERRSPISRIVEAERAARCATPSAHFAENARFNAELAAANAPSAPFYSPHSPQTAQTVVNAARSLAELDAPPLRIYRFPVWFPRAFSTRSSSARATERVVWDAATLFPKLPFSRGIATIDARGTATEARYAAFIDAFPLARNRDADAAFLDVAFFLGPPEIASRLAAADAANEFSTANVSLRRVVAPSNRVWIFRDGRPAPRSNERAEVVAYEPNRVVYLVELAAPAELVFAEQYWPDWRGRAYPLDADAAATLWSARFDADAASAFLKTRRGAAFDALIEPTLDFLRRTSLPAGTYCFVATYRPRRLLVGAILGAGAWSGLLAGAATLALRSRRRRREIASRSSEKE